MPPNNRAILRNRVGGGGGGGGIGRLNIGRFMQVKRSGVLNAASTRGFGWWHVRAGEQL